MSDQLLALAAQYGGAPVAAPAVVASTPAPADPGSASEALLALARQHGGATPGAVTPDFKTSNAPIEIPRDARGRPLVSSDLSDGPASPLLEMLGPFAHPQTLTDFARILTLPVDQVRKAVTSALTLAAARPAAASTLSTTGRALEKAGTAAQKPADIATALEAITSPKKAAITFAVPRLVKGAGQLLQRGGAALEEKPPAAAIPPTIGEAAEASAAPAAAPVAAPVTAAPTNALPNQKLLNELAIQARRAGVKLTPEMEKTAIDAVGKGATPQQAVRAFAPLAPAEAAPAAEAAPVWTPAKLRLTADEAKVAAKLIQDGKTDQEVQQAIEAARAFRKRFGTPAPTAAQQRFPKGMRGGAGSQGE